MEAEKDEVSTEMHKIQSEDERWQTHFAEVYIHILEWYFGNIYIYILLNLHLVNDIFISFQINIPLNNYINKGIKI